jgi:AraC-like DNA-binding protein
MDPFLDLVTLLRPRAALLGGGLDAAGQWSISFRKKDDLLFCWIEQGECQLVRSDHPLIVVQAGDFVLVRTSVPFILTSDPLMEPLDSDTAVAAAKSNKLVLGNGGDHPVKLHAGKFLFDTANEELLSGLLPSLVRISAKETSLERIHALLKMNEIEARQPGPASEFIIVRLVEIILVEILRSRLPGLGKGQFGLLSGLADPTISRALSAMHKDVANRWTVAKLARLCGVSRSTFATRFRKIVGVGPIDYLLRWRMALAKDELRLAKSSIAEISFAVGFESASAFSAAFSRSVGCSPKEFAQRGSAYGK